MTFLSHSCTRILHETQTDPFFCSLNHYSLVDNTHTHTHTHNFAFSNTPILPVMCVNTFQLILTIQSVYHVPKLIQI